MNRMKSPLRKESSKNLSNFTRRLTSNSKVKSKKIPKNFPTPPLSSSTWTCRIPKSPPFFRIRPSGLEKQLSVRREVQVSKWGTKKWKFFSWPYFWWRLQAEKYWRLCKSTGAAIPFSSLKNFCATTAEESENTCQNSHPTTDAFRVVAPLFTCWTTA